MSSYVAEIKWDRNGSTFTDNRYSRAHSWQFDGGISVPASSSPHSVREPFSDPANVDPEEAFVASISSCHMLWFLSIAAGAGYVVEHYVDAAQGWLERNEAGQPAMTRVLLRPVVSFTGSRVPTDAVLDDLHHQAHAACYIANSVKTTITVQGQWSHA